MAKDSVTLKYSPRTSTREYNTFTEEYFSGTDVSLYLNNVKMTQVSGLQYSVQEQLKPIFGYASRVFDEVAIGNRIIIGSFKVPITNTEDNVLANELITINHSNVNNSNSSNTPSWTVNYKKYKKEQEF